MSETADSLSQTVSWTALSTDYFCRQIWRAQTTERAPTDSMVCPSLGHKLGLEVSRSLSFWDFRDSGQMKHLVNTWHTQHREVLTVFLVHQNLKRVHLVVLEGLSNLLTHLFVCQLSIHEAAGENKHSPSSADRQSPALTDPTTNCSVCGCVVVPAGAALLHDLGPMVTGQFAEAIVAVDDRPVDDLSVPQHKIGIWPQKPGG